MKKEYCLEYDLLKHEYFSDKHISEVYNDESDFRKKLSNALTDENITNIKSYTREIEVLDYDYDIEGKFDKDKIVVPLMWILSVALIICTILIVFYFIIIAVRLIRGA